MTANSTPANNFPSIEGIRLAAARLADVVTHTPLQGSNYLSERYQANIALKREDLQAVRSFKIRGAFNKISKLSPAQRQQGIVCASAGNHSQGVAFACAALQIQASIFMPEPTPAQKVNQTRDCGRGYVEVVLVGDSFDEAYGQAVQYQRAHQATMIHPFDDLDIIEGQGTLALEILEDSTQPIDYLLIPVGGGGLAAGVASCFKALSPQTVLIGVEPAGAASMQASFNAGSNVALASIDTFIDGAAVKQSGELTYRVCREKLDQLIAVPEGKVCATLLDMYSKGGMVVEPAGALSVAALDSFAEQIVGKNVVCLVSGGNNDITRMEEIRERALLYEGKKHYFVVNFAQRAGALREFVVDVLGPEDDIVFFEYSKKTNRNHGPAVIGIETSSREQLLLLQSRMDKIGISYEYLNDQDSLFRFLI